MNDLTALKEELKAEIIAEMTAKKQQDSAWTKAKAALRGDVTQKLGLTESWRVVDSAATIGRMVLDVPNVKRFTEDDVATVRAMLGEILDVAMKYQREKQPIERK
jgi:hypothetical protein